MLRAGWPSGVALLTESSMVSLEGLSDDPPAGALVVLVCEFADVAGDAGRLVASGILGADLAQDFRVCVPVGERWTVSEVQELAWSLRRLPARRHVVLLKDAERLDRRALDRFLLLLEEPPSPLLVLLTVPRAELLPATIRGRASVVVELEVLSRRLRVDALVGQGVAVEVARQAVDLAGVRPSMAGPLAADGPLRDLASRCLVGSWDADAPVRDAYARLTELSTLAGVLSRIRAAPGEPVEMRVRRLDELDADGRVMLREVFDVWTGHRRAELRGRLAGLTSSEAPEFEATLVALDEFETRLRVPLPPGSVFSALLASAPLLRR